MIQLPFHRVGHSQIKLRREGREGGKKKEKKLKESCKEQSSLKQVKGSWGKKKNQAKGVEDNLSDYN